MKLHVLSESRTQNMFQKKKSKCCEMLSKTSAKISHSRRRHKEFPSVFKVNINFKETILQFTRMHSSRMRTVRISRRLLGGVPGPGGCTWSRGCSWSWGVYLVLGGHLVLGGVSGPRRVPAQVLPPVDRQTRVKT